jgi:hypothetical protein
MMEIGSETHARYLKQRVFLQHETSRHQKTPQK